MFARLDRMPVIARYQVVQVNEDVVLGMDMLRRYCVQWDWNDGRILLSD